MSPHDCRESSCGLPEQSAALNRGRAGKLASSPDAISARVANVVVAFFRARIGGRCVDPISFFGSRHPVGYKFGFDAVLAAYL